MPFYNDQVTPFIDEAKLQARIRELGQQITRDYQDQPVVVVGVLKGSILFFADLIRQIDLPIHLDFLGLSSYGAGLETSGVVRITSDLTKPIEGRHVLVVEDIIDTGLTMKFLLENLATRKPLSVKICSLLEKPARARVKVAIDYLGFTIPDEFVVGYGLDFYEKLRNLPFVGLMQQK
jgi:hypoxanthine phosphoribosyltransferase